ncbi:MAG: MFS transporter [Novosphingobium sp.]|nr:MFS transporter [Novosphingobium sp.]
MSAPSSPIRIADYRRFWLSRLFSVFATTSMVVLIGYQAYDIARADYGMSKSEAAFQLGLLGLAQFIPILLLTPVAGLAADRFDRRKVAAAANVVDASLATLLAFLTTTGALTLPILFIIAASHGAARIFTMPAMTAIAPNIVPEALLPRAIALSSIAFQTGTVVGPAVGGLLYAAHAPVPHVLSAVLLLLSSLLVLSIKPLPPDPHSDLHPLRQIIEGVQFTWKERFLLGCISLDLFAVLLGGATAMLPVFARDILQVGPEGLGLMRGAPALGAAAVALLLSIKPIENNVGVKMLWAVVAFGAATILFGLSRNFVLSLGLLSLLGAADMVSVYIRSSLVQLYTPNAMRGRVSALSGLAISASNELGEMQSGLAAAVLGVTGAVVFGGAGAIFVTALWAWLFPELRKARTFATRFKESERENPV